MHKKQRKSYILALGLSLMLVSCSVERKNVQAMPNASLEEWNLLREKGDQDFSKMFWQGWKNAIDYYEKALLIKEDPDTWQKLFNSLLLLIVRELECEHPNISYLEKLEKVLEKVRSNENKSYFLLAKSYVTGRAANDFPNRFVHSYDPGLETLVIPEDKTNAFKSYLHLYFTGERARDFDVYRKEQDWFCESFKDFNLAVFLNQSSLGLTDCERHLQSHPDFYEILAKRGQIYSLQKKYKRTLEDYGKVIKKMPFWITIGMEMGKIFMTLEEDEKAIECYENVLKIKTLYAPALFGKGVCLSNLNQLDLANAVFSEMIERQSLYHGEAYYYLARNHYLQGKKTESRSEADLAKTFIPDSVELLLLSGILYLEDKEFDKAENDFRLVLEKNNRVGDAHLYIGQIALQKKRPSEAPAHFVLAAVCYWRDVAEMDNRRESINEMEISEDKKKMMNSKLLLSELNYIQDSKKKLGIAKGLISKIKKGNEIGDILLRLEEKQKALEMLKQAGAG